MITYKDATIENKTAIFSFVCTEGEISAHKMRTITFATTMLTIVFATAQSSKLCTAFVTSSIRSHSARSSTKVSSAASSIFADFQKAFSTMIDSESSSKSASPYFTIAVSGATGLVGNALLDELNKQNNQINSKPVKVIQLIRSETTPKKQSERVSTVSWNPQAPNTEEAIDISALKGVDAVINLSGENISTGLGPLGFLGLRPWTQEKKESVLASRVPGAKALAHAVRQVADAENRPISYLCASGVGIYGCDYFAGSKDTAAEESMDTTNTKGFLATVSRQWEEAANSAPSKNVRVANLRFGVVLSKKGGALAKLYPIYFLGGGGVVGSGDQYFSFISARDAARAILHTLETTSLKGPVNVASPNPCTYRDFNSAMGKVLNRPTIVPLPSFAVDLLFGEMGQEMLLGGVKVKPSKLLGSGFEFKHDTIENAVESAVSESI